MKELYKVYRPRKLEDIVGNSTTVEALQSYLEAKELPHTILLTGPSGCGKTTIGRILKRELGCGTADYRELNCADFRGIDTVREISRNMSLAPIGGVCRVFLLDEVHQLSADGQNAALKILEDTPAHVYFILCTTDPGKLKKTIRTRCCELPVSLLSEKDSLKLLQRTASKAEITITVDHLEKITEAAQGSARTALVLLDKISRVKPEKREKALKKAAEEEQVAIDLCRALLKKADWREVATILKGIQEEPEQIRWAVLGYARSVLLSGRKDTLHQAYTILCAFENHFYDSKHAGLARASFESIFGGE